MSWFKTDDQLHGHPKPRRAGLEAMGLWVVCGSHSAAYKGEGFVPAWYVESWPKGRRLAGQLVAAGLWEEASKDGLSGYEFHDWAHYQPTAEEVERDREAARLRQRNRRKRLAQSALDKATDSINGHP